MRVLEVLFSEYKSSLLISFAKNKCLVYLFDIINILNEDYRTVFTIMLNILPFIYSTIIYDRL